MAAGDKIDKVAGKAKEGVGKATDDDLKNEGRTQHGVAKAKDAVKDAASKIKEAARDMTDRDR
ncbi:MULTISPECIES: hypothetical protein [Thermocrispum]|jgi:uncharacterized protein YjbJ (UPF0337 family)|uniref:CsbD family protein n=1 Tax=Thermocrispum agreste TaxID=37925 RepID=A0A2W4J8P6_9PSEU|nr:MULTISPECIES: hypothetical protein [Thermocrispum]PZM95540.1 MAG: CsbD family protein [Thermocrispum agreste]